MAKTHWERVVCASLVGSFLTLIAACGTPESRAAVREYVDRRDGYTESVEAMTAALSNATLVTQDPNSLVEQHGTQTEFHGSDGTSYLWYPGNSVIVEGQWRVQNVNSSGIQLCYRYGLNTYNPITGERGGAWECRSFRFTPFMQSDFLEGDPFDLKSGQVPFVIPDRRRYYPEHLVRMLGGDPTQIVYRDRRPLAQKLLRQIELETQQLSLEES